MISTNQIERFLTYLNNEVMCKMDFCLWINVHRSHKWCGVVVVVWHCWVWPKYFKMIKSNNSTISWAGMLTSIEVTICCYLNTKCLWSNIGSHSSDLPLFRGGGRWGSKFWLPPPMEGGGGWEGGGWIWKIKRAGEPPIKFSKKRGRAW